MVTGESVARQHQMVCVMCRMTVVGEEEEESKGGAEDQMVEAEKRRLLRGRHGDVEKYQMTE